MTKEERELRRQQRERQRELEMTAREAGRGPLDVPFLLLTLLLTGIGLIMLFSASFPSAYYESGNPAYYLIRQAIFAALGIAAMLVVGRVNYERFRAVSKLLLGFSVLLLVAVLVPGIGVGRATHGAQRWIRSIGPIPQFQPSEIAKVGVILFFADSIIARNAHYIAGIFLDHVGIQSHEQLTHRIGFFYIGTEDNRLGHAANLVKHLRNASGHHFAACLDNEFAAKIGALV